MINKPGIYEISETEYHADPVCEPSLSRGIAHLLITRSPMHAHYAHPRLGKGKPIEASKVMDAGSAVHSLVLGAGAKLVALEGKYGPKHEQAGKPFLDYKTAAAALERDALREAGHIPCLQHELPELRRAAAAVTKQLRWHQDGADFFAPGQSEVMVVAKIGAIWARILVDRLPVDHRAPAYDLKMTKLAATPASWERQIIEKYAFQCAFYRRVLYEALGYDRPATRFVVGELDAPHGASMMCAAPTLMAIADGEVDRAFRMWDQCVMEDRWPSYPTYTAHVEAPVWKQLSEEDRVYRDEQMKEMDDDVHD